MIAAQKGKYEATKLLIKHKADINKITFGSIYNDISGRITALYFASRYGNTDIVRLLLENGVDTEIIQDTLHSATFYNYGNDEIGNLLIEHGATPLNSDQLQDILDNKLHWNCAAGNHTEIKRFLGL